MSRNVLVGMLVACLALLSACGSSDVSDDAQSAASEDSSEGAGESVVITAVDYAFTDVPETIEAGTTIVLQNDSEAEVHELLAWRLSDDETRPVSELATLPADEFEAVVAGPPIIAPLAPPGADSTAAPTPPAVLTEPGRYAFVCLIPTDAPPDEVMAAVQEFVDAGGDAPGGPSYPDTGPPHVVSGMFAEATVQ